MGTSAPYFFVRQSEKSLMNYKTKTLVNFFIYAMWGVIQFSNGFSWWLLALPVLLAVSFSKHQKINATMIEMGIFISAVVASLGLEILRDTFGFGIAGVIFGGLFVSISLTSFLYLTLPDSVIKYWK